MGVRQHGLVARRGHGAIAIFRLVSVREEETLVARLSAHVTEILNARPQATLALATELIRDRRSRCGGYSLRGPWESPLHPPASATRPGRPSRRAACRSRCRT